MPKVFKLVMWLHCLNTNWTDVDERRLPVTMTYRTVNIIDVVVKKCLEPLSDILSGQRGELPVFYGICGVKRKQACRNILWPRMDSNI